MKIDIEKLALLARIKLTPQEKEKLQKEFEVILDYIPQLKDDKSFPQDKFLIFCYNY